MASAALKLIAVSSDFIDDEYLSQSDFIDEDNDRNLSTFEQRIHTFFHTKLFYKYQTHTGTAKWLRNLHYSGNRS